MTQLNVPNATMIPSGRRSYTRKGKKVSTMATPDSHTAIRLLVLGFWHS